MRKAKRNFFYKLDIGNDMASVKLPLLACSITDDDVPANGSWTKENPYPQINPSSILWYLGKKGWGRKTTAGIVTAKSNALKLLSYYDIYKNYYANVQQTDAYIVGASLGFTNGTATGATPNTFTSLSNMNLNIPANTSVVVLAFNHNIGRPLTNAEINSIQIFVARYPDMTGQIGTTISNLGTIAGNTTTQLTLKLNKLE